MSPACSEPEEVLTTGRSDFVIPWRARYYEVDQQGVVFNSWYLAWFDEAMSAFLAADGLDSATLATEGIDFQLVRVEIDWREGVRWGEQVWLTVRPEKTGTTSFQMEFTIVRDQVMACQARITYVSIAPDGSGKTPVPHRLRAALQHVPLIRGM